MRTEQLLSQQLEVSIFLTIIGVIGSFWEGPFAFHRAHLVYFPLMKGIDSTVLTWLLWNYSWSGDKVGKYVSILDLWLQGNTSDRIPWDGWVKFTIP